MNNRTRPQKSHAPQPRRTREQLLAELRKGKSLLVACHRIKEHYKAIAEARPRCYACEEPATGARDRRPEGGKLELACPRHSEPEHTPPEPGARRVGEIVELDRNCELGEYGERAIVTELDGDSMALVFPARSANRRRARTGADYRYLRSV